MYLWLGLRPKHHWERFPNPTGRAYSAPPGLLAGREGARCPFPKNFSPLSAFGLEFWPFGPQEYPHLRHGFCKQSELLQRLPLHWKGWKTFLYSIEAITSIVLRTGWHYLLIVSVVQEWQKVQEDFEKNWVDGTFPGWPVNISLICPFWHYCVFVRLKDVIVWVFAEHLDAFCATV